MYHAVCKLHHQQNYGGGLCHERRSGRSQLWAWERALTLLYRAAESISGTNKMIFDLALKINQSKINAEDAMLSAQSMDGDGV